MGKDTDKMYVTHSEHSAGAGGYKGKPKGSEFRRLPFSCCALALTPFEIPRATKEGHVFDLVHILPWIKKHGTNPVTGQALSTKDLIPLHFHKNAQGQYHDPVTFKVFSDNTHIVAVATTGHVYAWDTIDEMCVKAKSWKDLMTDEPFKRKDLITIQDPHNISQRNINDFHYKVNELEKPPSTATDPAGQKQKEIARTINASGTTARVLAAMVPAAKQDSSPMTPSFVQKAKAGYNMAHYSDNSAAGSFTSLGAVAVTKNAAALVSDNVYLIENVKEAAFATLRTSEGDISVELFVSVAPMACLNFVKLSKNGYYKDMIFHRCIRNFMIQTGDPTGTGRGGQSYYGKTFPDEVKNKLSHDERGVLSMANKGKDTNGSQFFITFKQCKHLDGKHTIFGKVTEGLDVLDRMESKEVDSDDRPKKPIKLIDVTVTFDPFEKAMNILHGTDEESVRKSKEAEAKKAKREAQDRIVARLQSQKGNTEVGKYLKAAESSTVTGSSTSKRVSEPSEFASDQREDEERLKKKKKASSGFDFSSW